MKKFFISIMLTFCLFSISCLSASAKDDASQNLLDPYETTEEDNTTPQPRWWPGDPNPQPGSQEWLWTHATMTPGTPTKARSCAIEAITVGGLGNSALSKVSSWIAREVFTVASFASSFGVGAAINYLQCILR